MYFIWRNIDMSNTYQSLKYSVIVTFISYKQSRQMSSQIKGLILICFLSKYKMKTSYGVHNYIKFVKIPFFGQMLLSFMYFASILGQVMAPITSPPSSQRPLSRHRASSRFPSTIIHSRASSQDEEGTSKIGGMCICLLLECILFLHFYDSTTKRLFMFLVFKI